MPFYQNNGNPAEAQPFPLAPHKHMAWTPKSGANFIDRTGHRYGKWLVLKRTDQIKDVRYICQCDCGTTREVSGKDLQSGRTNSCGCLKAENKGKTLTRENKREHHSWSGMKQRCFYEKHIEYHRYGGRGITVSEKWVSDFAQFLRDMGPCPPGFSIDRIDNDGDYSKENCKWSNKAEQSANTSRNVNVEYDGTLMTLKQLAAKLNLNYSRLHSQFRRKGLPLEEAIRKVQAPGINRPYRFRPQTSPEQLLCIGGPPPCP